MVVCLIHWLLPTYLSPFTNQNKNTFLGTNISTWHSWRRCYLFLMRDMLVAYSFLKSTESEAQLFQHFSNFSQKVEDDLRPESHHVGEEENLKWTTRNGTGKRYLLHLPTQYARILLVEGISQIQMYDLLVIEIHDQPASSYCICRNLVHRIHDGSMYGVYLYIYIHTYI